VPNVAIAFAQKAWINTPLYMRYLRECVAPFMPKGRAALIIHDAYKVHVTPRVERQARQLGMIHAAVAKTLTGLLSPLDVGVFHPFHTAYWQRHDEYFASVKMRDLTASQRRGVLVTHVAERWQRQPTAHVVNRCARTGVSLPMDGSLDNRMNIDVGGRVIDPSVVRSGVASCKCVHDAIPTVTDAMRAPPKARAQMTARRRKQRGGTAVQSNVYAMPPALSEMGTHGHDTRYRAF
jgi:hypothetical protein